MVPNDLHDSDGELYEIVLYDEYSIVPHRRQITWYVRAATRYEAIEIVKKGHPLRGGSNLSVVIPPKTAGSRERFAEHFGEFKEAAALEDAAPVVPEATQEKDQQDVAGCYAD